jgi:hypothetical protein
MSAPNPTMLAKVAQRRHAAEIDPNAKAKVVRPGLVVVEVPYIHDGVIKTKHLVPGITVRPFLHGEPRGGERVIKSVTKIDDGATWHVEFASAHVDQDYKAAYRWYCEAIDGATMTRKVRQPALVPYQEA